MRYHSLTVGLLLAGAVAFAPSTAFADNTTCANGDFLFMGIGRGQTITNATSRFYKVRVVEGRSYSVYSWAPFQDTGEGGANINHVLWSDSACTTAAGVVASSPKEPTVATTGHSGDNDTIIPNFTGTMYIEVLNNASASQTIYTAIQETTIFSSWWFVGGDYGGYATIKNATNTSIAYTLTAYAPNGTVCGTSSGTLSGNGNTFVNIRNWGTCLAAGSGSAQVAFQGPPGAVIGNITTLSATTGLSFDAPMTPRMPWAISTQ